MLCAVNLKKSNVMMALVILFGLLISIGLCLCNVYFHQCCGWYFRPKLPGLTHRMTAAVVENQGHTLEEEVVQMNKP